MLFSSGAEGEGAVFPYHSVLLKEGKEALHKCLPVDASPQLRRLIDAASPVKSLSQLQVCVHLVRIVRYAPVAVRNVS